MAYYVYILASKPYGTFYVGVTNNLVRRVYEHKNDLIAGFTQQYRIKTLVYYEIHDEIESAIRREKSIKRWTRNKKIDAIQEMNPQWRDLYETIL